MGSNVEISKYFLENISSNKFILTIAKVLSNIAENGIIWWIAIAALLFLHFKKDKKIEYRYLIASALLVLFWLVGEYYLKGRYQRLRPYQEIEGFQALIDTVGYKYPTSSSFPSGHSLFSFGMFMIILNYDKKYFPYALGLASVIALSRIILGAHYVSDVIAGIGYGIAVGSLSVFLTSLIDKLIKKYYKPHESKKVCD